jgi:signal transduction histidine kinase
MIGLLLLGRDPADFDAGRLAGTLLVVLGVASILAGFRAFYGRPAGDSLIWPTTVLTMAGVLWFGLAAPSMRARIAIVSGGVAVLLLRSAHVALRFGRRLDGAAALMVGGALVSLGVLAVARAGHAIFVATEATVRDAAPTQLFLVATAIAGIACMVGVAAGVNLRLVQQARRARTSMEKLVSVTAHELRAPITSLLGSLDILQAESSEESDPERWVPMALRNAERLRYLVDDLLELEKLEAGKTQLEIVDADPASIVDEAVESNRPFAEQREVRLEADCSGSLTAVRVDPKRMQQVLTNLITNAVKHSPAGKPVRVSCRPNALGVCFEVADQGSGIPAEVRARVFERFVSRATPSEDVKSTGLGLAIARSIVEAHGGSIGFETEEGKGTTFCVELPDAS